MYLQLWQIFPPMWTKEARLDLEIGRVKTAMELADVVAYCQKKKYTAYHVTSSSKGSVVLTAEADPFVQIADMLQAPKAYKEALAEMDKDFVANIIKETKMGKKATARFMSHIAKGDKKTELEIKVK